jgi:hypothetical protein
LRVDAERRFKVLSQRGFDILNCRHNQLPQSANVNNPDAVLVHPLLEVEPRRTPILSARQARLEPAHDVASHILGHRLKPDRFAGELPVVGERVGVVVVQCAQHTEFRQIYTALLAEIPRQTRWYLLVNVEGAAGHSYETRMYGDCQPVETRAGIVDQHALAR